MGAVTTASTSFLLGGVDRIEAESHRRFAAHFAGAADGAAEHGILVVIDDDDIMRIGPQPAVELIAPPEDIELGQVGRVGEQLVHAVDDVLAPDGAGPGSASALTITSGADAGGVAHGDRDGGAVVHTESTVRRIPRK